MVMQVVHAARKMMDQEKTEKRTAIPLANEQTNE